MNNINKCRIRKEIEMLSTSPPAGISCFPVNDRLDLLSAQILGQSGTPFEGGVFNLEVQIPERYPFDPPRIRFVTPIYHPNVDTNGRICLDTLKLPPKSSWRPCLNISTVLMMIRILMAEPGSEDPLMTSIWQEYKYNYSVYVEKAKQWTRQHATTQCLTQDKQATKAAAGPKTHNMSSSDVEEIRDVVISTSGQNAQLEHKQTSHSDKVNQSTNPTAKPSVDEFSLKSKKTLGLSSKRHTLEEVNVNSKLSKMS